MTHEELRRHHFERLNNYRRSAEYAEFAKATGADILQGDLPCLIGNRWEIDEQIYTEALGILPPLGWRGGSFYMSEFTFADITAKFSKNGDKYYCEFARYPERKQVPTETPWGPSQHTQPIASGIVRYDTASHGGFHLSPERVAQMPKALREFKPFAGPNWYEEDCDWSVVVLAFPKFFDEELVRSAGNFMKNYKPEIYQQYLVETGQTELPKASRFLMKWLDIGKKNEWISEANDPPFTLRSLHQCKDDAELLDKFAHGNWCLGQAFHIGDLCFIQQVDGGDEWLTIKEDRAFESMSFGRIIAREGREAAQEIIGRIREATIEKCRSLDY